MTKRKSKSKKRGITRDQLWQIWKAVDAQNWLEIARTYCPSSHFEFAGQDLLKGLCPKPEHNDSAPSFFVYPHRGYAKCFGCGYFTISPIDLTALLLNNTDAEAIQFLYDKYKLTFLSKKAVAELEAQKLNQLTKRAIYAATHDVLCEAIAEPNTFPYATEALDWLINERQVPKDSLHALPVGILPPLDILSKILDTKYRKLHETWKKNPGTIAPENLAQPAIEYLKDYMSDPAFTGSIVWPLHISPSDIGRLKFRVPNSGDSKKFIIPNDEFEDLLGLYGLGWQPYKELLDPKNHSEWVYLTEGEMDVMSCMARTVDTGPSFPIFSVGGRGGAAYIEPILKLMGVRGVYLIGDAPHKGSAGGDPVVLGWAEKLSELQIKVFTGWDKLDPSGDLDEAVLRHGVDKITEVLWKETKENFTPVWAWVADKAEKELETVPSDDIRQLIECGAKYGQYLKNKTDVQSFVDYLGAHFEGVNPLHLKREIVAKGDNEASFIVSCTEAMKDILFSIGTTYSSNNRSLVLQHRTTKQIHKIRLDSEQSVAQELAPITGTLINFVEEHIGFPHFIENPLSSDNLVYQRADRQLRYYMREAIQGLALGCPDFDSAPQLRQGYHWVEHEDGISEYLVCGADVFTLSREGGNLTYRKLDGPADKGIVFDIGFQRGTVAPPWYPGGLTTQILDDGKNEDLSAIYDQLLHFFDIGFKYKHHNVVKELLAGLALVFPIMSAFPRQLLVFFTGDTHSGKTNLLSVFSGAGAPKIRLLLCSHDGLEHYTAAGVRNLTNSDSRLLTLDEFEFSDQTRARHIEEIMHWVRGLVTSKAVSIKATRDGSYDRSIHRFPVIFSAISGAEKPQDLNRLLIIEMDKVEGRNTPSNILVGEFGIDGIERLARKMATAIYPHVPALRQNYEEIEREFPKLQALVPFTVESRYASSLFGVLALMRYLGRDWRGFFKEFVMQNKSTIHRAATVTESESYLNAMLFNPAIFQHETNSTACVAQLLANEHKREQINSAAVGVFYDNEQSLLLVHLEQALSRLMPSSYKLRQLTGNRLKDTLERHKMALSPREIQHSGILKKIIPYIGANVDTKDVVVFHADPWVVSLEEMAESMTATTKKLEQPEVKAEDVDPAADKDW